MKKQFFNASLVVFLLLTITSINLRADSSFLVTANQATQTLPSFFDIALPAPGTITKREYVNSIQDYHIFNLSHIQRVHLLGMTLFDRFEFPGVDRQLLSRYLLNHDREKIDTSATFLRGHGLPLEGPHFRDLLYQNYGKFLGKVPASTHTLIMRMNGVAESEDLRFFRKHGLIDRYGNPNSVALAMMYIAVAADKVDRGSSPVTGEEMAKVTELASKYITYLPEYKKEPRLMEWVLFLEGIYTEVVDASGLEFKSFLHSMRSAAGVVAPGSSCGQMSALPIF